MPWRSTLNRIVTLAFAALVASGAALAQAADYSYKIGFVNTERLFREAAPAKRAQQKLEREFAARDAEIQKLGKQVRDLQAALDKDSATMPEAERRNKERDLANLSRDLSALAARVPRGPEPAPQRGAGRPAGAGEPGHPADRRVGEVRPDPAGPRGVREPAHRHHREGDQGACRQVGASRAAAGITT